MSTRSPASLAQGVTVGQYVHLDDLDGYGMLHHTRYAVLFDHAVMDWWQRVGWTPDLRTSMLVVREIRVSFHHPITAVGEVAVHFWISDWGRTSITYHFEMTCIDRKTIHADGSRVVVNLDPTTQRPAPMDQDLRRMAAPLVVGADSAASEA